MKITIIVPVYNVEKYILRCLTSIVEQNVINTKLECIIVNDCSPDNSMLLVNDFLRDYVGSIQFLIVSHDKNYGLSAARNTGLANATGDYVFYIDSDDWLLPNTLQSLIDELYKNQFVDIVIGNYISKKNNSLFFPTSTESILLQGSDVILKELFKEKININAWNKLIRRDILISNNIYFIDGILFEDVPWSYDVYHKIDRILVCPQIVSYSYEYNVNSIFNTAKSNYKKSLDSYIIITNYLLDSLEYQNNNKNVLFFVDEIIFIGRYFFKATELFSISDRANIDKQSFNKTRKRLVKYVIKNRLFFLLSASILFYYPFFYVQHLKLFRHNFHKIERLVSNIESFLHKS